MRFASQINLPGFDRCFLDGPMPAMDCRLPLLVGYSVRNRSFSVDLFSRIFFLAAKYFSRLEVLIVDDPYAWNEAALRGDQNPTEADLEKSRRIGDERFRMVRGALSTKPAGLNVRLSRWQEYAQLEEVKTLRDELHSAAQLHTTIRDALSSYSQLWRGEVSSEDADLFYGFLIEEFPVFVHLYYREGYSVDIYPGPNFPFFKALERQEWLRELPLASELARDKQLSFLNVGVRDASL